MNRCFKSITAWTTLLLTGCATEFVTFQSAQLVFLRDEIFGNIDRGPRPEWVIHWLGEERHAYAINGEGQILFANEYGDLLRFYDNQIVEARNLLPGGKIVLIEKGESGLQYRVNGNSLGLHVCLNWEEQRTEKSSTRRSFVQKCSHNEIDYVNRFWVNQDRQLVRLIYHIHSQYPQVRVELAKK